MADHDSNPWSDDGDFVKPLGGAAGPAFAEAAPEVRRPMAPGDRFAHSIVRVLAYRRGESIARKAGSAVFVRPDLLISAGHVIFDPAHMHKRKVRNQPHEKTFQALS